MKPANYFDMINRTVGEPLPSCIFYDYDEEDGYRVEFYADFDTLSEMPVRIDILVDDTYLVGDAVQRELHKNGKGYVAIYYAYALHQYKDAIPI